MRFRPTAIIICIVTFLSVFSVPTLALDDLWALQAVDSTGLHTHPKVGANFFDPANIVVVEGVALAGVDEILNPAGMYTVFLQDDTQAAGGIQAWAGSWFYDPADWQSYRTTDYVDFQAGDRLRITGFAADPMRGKAFINHRHSDDPDLVFTVEVLSHVGLPDPALIPTVGDCNYFDQTRSGGGELYQTRYVMLHGVEITSGTWANNELLTVEDTTGQVGMLLSGQGDFSSFSQPTGKISVVGIFDQEDVTSPQTGDYRVWVKKYADIANAMESCSEIEAFNDGERVALANKIVSRTFNGYYYIQDAQRASGIRIVSTRSVQPGDEVAVQGIVSTLANSEKAIVPDYTYMESTGNAVRPLGISGKALAAVDGLKTTGLLVTVCGTLADNSGDWTIETANGTYALDTSNVVMPAVSGRFVSVTGVSSLENGGTSATILVSQASDIVTQD